MSQFKIIEASAGSGKTFSLIREYLSVVLQKPDNYRSILAVTFTNKATDEMKSRVLTELFALSVQRDSKHLDFLVDYLNTDAQTVALKAKECLSRLLNNYSFFSISTIDRFFQRIIRSFSSELGLDSSYNLEIDEKEILEKAVDELFYTLEKRENARLTKWLVEFAEKEIEEGNSWNIRKSVFNIGRELFKEEVRNNNRNSGSNLIEKDQLSTFRESLLKKTAHFETTIFDKGTKALAIMNRYGIVPSDFKWGKTGGMMLIEQLANKQLKSDKFVSPRVENIVESVENWYPQKTTKKDAICAAGYEGGLHALFCEILDYYRTESQIYYSALAILRNFYTYGILIDIEEQIRNYTAEQNIITISESNQLIADINKWSDPPFIYEKTGTRYDHFFIDEFQDTSRLQWINFKPLIEESLASDNMNLVVGDIKQSIYRWRNSDWKLMGLEIRDDFRADQYAKELRLLTNYRSSRNVIAFNNILFPLLAESINTTIEANLEKSNYNPTWIHTMLDNYRKSQQQVPDFKPKTGLVELCFELKANEETEEDLLFTWVEEKICFLLDNGYSQSDIAILVRRKAEGQAMVDYLSSERVKHKKYSYQTISDEALVLGNAVSVRFLIAVMECVNDASPLNLNNLNMMAEQLFDPSQEEHLKFDDTEFIAELFESLKKTSLLEMAMKIVSQFNLFQLNQHAYIHRFIDEVKRFESRNYSGLNDFLNYWRDKGVEKSLSDSAEKDAINVMTIHKSKGLEFRVVIIPYLDWKMDDSKNDNLLWVTPTDKIDDRNIIVPVKYGKSLAETEFKNRYFEEQLLNFVDSLNLLYVALTRPIDALFTYACLKSDIINEPRNGTISEVVFLAINNVSKNSDTFQNITTETHIEFKMGVLPEPVVRKVENNSFASEFKSTYTINKNLFIRAKSLYANDKQNFGKVMHAILEEVDSIEQIKSVVLQYVDNGHLTELEAKTVHETLDSKMQNPLVAAWFNTNAKVLREQSILTPGGKTYRPDRIVIDSDVITIIDFKFGNAMVDYHQKQVKNYISLVQSIAQKSVKGYVWYFFLDEILEVE